MIQVLDNDHIFDLPREEEVFLDLANYIVKSSEHLLEWINLRIDLVNVEDEDWSESVVNTCKISDL